MRGKKAIFDKVKPVLSFEQTFLSTRDYKRIFCISVIFAVLRGSVLIPILAEWKLTEAEASVMAVLVFVLEMLSGVLFLLIPVMLLLRISLGYLLKKNLQQLEKTTWQRDKAMRLQKRGLEGDQSLES
ncbi:Uncharacterised protein [Candidatus Bartonella washoeensis]|uniref:Uncharacterized protein n=1 Tax=Candidatus Bartonella washoeensis Sb944nv TaxID=1094563 RepID=J0YYH0_9HYPH|nr:hypothetical protein MCQ_00536 [Bartonella washoeensis Sb944nv]SPU26112.1 Uncharacterised protein [Bartonella washoeensis]